MFIRSRQTNVRARHEHQERDHREESRTSCRSESGITFTVYGLYPIGIGYCQSTLEIERLSAVGIGSISIIFCCITAWYTGIRLHSPTLTRHHCFSHLNGYPLGSVFILKMLTLLLTALNYKLPNTFKYQSFCGTYRLQDDIQRVKIKGYYQRVTIRL